VRGVWASRAAERVRRTRKGFILAPGGTDKCRRGREGGKGGGR